MNQKKLSVNLYVATESERETRFVTVEAHRSVCICTTPEKTTTIIILLIIHEHAYMYGHSPKYYFYCMFFQECNDPCCDARTCRPAADAECTKGECCTSTCRFKTARTTCRRSRGQCDIEERCSGRSADCPADVYLQDGSSCNNNRAYCFSGECRTYDTQCQKHFKTSKFLRVYP